MKKFFLISILVHLLFIVSISFFSKPDKVAENPSEFNYVVSIKEITSSTTKKDFDNKLKKSIKHKDKNLQRTAKNYRENKPLKKSLQKKSATIKTSNKKVGSFVSKSELKKTVKIFSQSGVKKNQVENEQVPKGKLFIQPSYRFSPRPDYPLTAKKRGYEGEVLINVYVLSSGAVGELQLLKPSGYEMLDESAVLAVKSWKFNPAKNNGVAVSTWVKVPISFKLISG